MSFARLVINLGGLSFLRLFASCRISSRFVSYKALKGKGIQVQSGTRIDASSSLGGYSYIGHYCYITRTKIGRYVSIANNVSIGQGEHDLTKISTSTLFVNGAWEALTKENCEIGNDVWVGVDAVILRGVKIGNGAVVAANAVVTSDVPDFAIVAGAPARLLRYRFPEHFRRMILRSLWWDLELNMAKDAQRKLEQEFNLDQE